MPTMLPTPAPLCSYRGRQCNEPRARKRDGHFHRFCDRHRALFNQYQRKSMGRRRETTEVVKYEHRESSLSFQGRDIDHSDDREVVCAAVEMLCATLHAAFGTECLPFRHVALRCVATNQFLDTRAHEVALTSSERPVWILATAPSGAVYLETLATNQSLDGVDPCPKLVPLNAVSDERSQWIVEAFPNGYCTIKNVYSRRLLDGTRLTNDSESWLSNSPDRTHVEWIIEDVKPTPESARQWRYVDLKLQEILKAYSVGNTIPMDGLPRARAHAVVGPLIERYLPWLIDSTRHREMDDRYRSVVIDQMHEFLDFMNNDKVSPRQEIPVAEDRWPYRRVRKEELETCLAQIAEKVSNAYVRTMTLSPEERLVHAARDALQLLLVTAFAGEHTRVRLVSIRNISSRRFLDGRRMGLQDVLLTSGERSAQCDPNLQWFLSTTNSGRAYLKSVSSSQLLDGGEPGTSFPRLVPPIQLDTMIEERLQWEIRGLANGYASITSVSSQQILGGRLDEQDPWFVSDRVDASMNPCFMWEVQDIGHKVAGTEHAAWRHLDETIQDHLASVLGIGWTQETEARVAEMARRALADDLVGRLIQQHTPWLVNSIQDTTDMNYDVRSVIKDRVVECLKYTTVNGVEEAKLQPALERAFEDIKNAYRRGNELIVRVKEIWWLTKTVLLPLLASLTGNTQTPEMNIPLQEASSHPFMGPLFRRHLQKLIDNRSTRVNDPARMIIAAQLNELTHLQPQIFRNVITECELKARIRLACAAVGEFLNDASEDLENYQRTQGTDKASPRSLTRHVSTTTNPPLSPTDDCLLHATAHSPQPADRETNCHNHQMPLGIAATDALSTLVDVAAFLHEGSQPQSERYGYEMPIKSACLPTQCTPTITNAAESQVASALVSPPQPPNPINCQSEGHVSASMQQLAACHSFSERGKASNEHPLRSFPSATVLTGAPKRLPAVPLTTQPDLTEEEIHQLVLIQHRLGDVSLEQLVTISKKVERYVEHVNVITGAGPITGFAGQSPTRPVPMPIVAPFVPPAPASMVNQVHPPALPDRQQSFAAPFHETPSSPRRTPTPIPSQDISTPSQTTDVRSTASLAQRTHHDHAYAEPPQEAFTKCERTRNVPVGMGSSTPRVDDRRVCVDVVEFDKTSTSVSEGMREESGQAEDPRGCHESMEIVEERHQNDQTISTTPRKVDDVEQERELAVSPVQWDRSAVHVGIDTMESVDGSPSSPADNTCMVPSASKCEQSTHSLKRKELKVTQEEKILYLRQYFEHIKKWDSNQIDEWFQHQDYERIKGQFRTVTGQRKKLREQYVSLRERLDVHRPKQAIQQATDGDTYK